MSAISEHIERVVNNAKTTLKTVIIGKLSNHGGEMITSENGGDIANEIIEVIQEDDVSWALEVLVINLGAVISKTIQESKLGKDFEENE